eukprot:scaffold19457_cov49-Attheya_sp.AAC.8
MSSFVEYSQQNESRAAAAPKLWTTDDTQYCNIIMVEQNTMQKLLLSSQLNQGLLVIPVAYPAIDDTLTEWRAVKEAEAEERGERYRYPSRILPSFNVELIVHCTIV